MAIVKEKAAFVIWERDLYNNTEEIRGVILNDWDKAERYCDFLNKLRKEAYGLEYFFTMESIIK